jgi:hypothetical protein
LGFVGLSLAGSLRQLAGIKEEAEEEPVRHGSGFCHKTPDRENFHADQSRQLVASETFEVFERSCSHPGTPGARLPGVGFAG